MVQQVKEGLYPRRSPTGYPGVDRLAESGHEADPTLSGEGIDLGNRGVADTAPGNVQDAPGRHLIDRIGRQLQVRQGITDLTAVIEAGATDHPVRDAEVDHLLLDGPTLSVGPVEDGHIRPPPSRIVQGPDAAHDPAGLVHLVIGAVTDNAVTRAGIGPEVLRLATGVPRDDGVGRIQDRLG